MTLGGRGQKRVKYEGDDTGEELEDENNEVLDNEVKNDDENEDVLMDPRPPKVRRTLEASRTPATAAPVPKKETFLQVFNTFMKTRATRMEKAGQPW